MPIVVPTPTSPTPPSQPQVAFQNAVTAFAKAAKTPINAATDETIERFVEGGSKDLMKGLDALKTASIPASWDPAMIAKFEIAKGNIFKANINALVAEAKIMVAFAGQPDWAAEPGWGDEYADSLPSNAERREWKADFRAAGDAARAGAEWLNALAGK